MKPKESIYPAYWPDFDVFVSDSSHGIYLGLRNVGEYIPWDIAEEIAKEIMNRSSGAKARHKAKTKLSNNKKKTKKKPRRTKSNK